MAAKEVATYFHRKQPVATEVTVNESAPVMSLTELYKAVGATQQQIKQAIEEAEDAEFMCEPISLID